MYWHVYQREYQVTRILEMHDETPPPYISPSSNWGKEDDARPIQQWNIKTIFKEFCVFDVDMKHTFFASNLKIKILSEL